MNIKTDKNYLHIEVDQFGAHVYVDKILRGELLDLDDINTECCVLDFDIEKEGVFSIDLDKFQEDLKKD